MARQPISSSYLKLSEKDREERARRRPVKNLPGKKQRFAVTRGVLAGTDLMHQLSKRGRPRCGTVLAEGSFTVALQQPRGAKLCPQCAEVHFSSARQVKPDKPVAKRKKRPARPESYPGENLDRNTRGKRDPNLVYGFNVGQPGMGKRQ